MPSTVVLRHDLSDGSHHFDWLIEPAAIPHYSPHHSPQDPDARVLIAWRLPAPPHRAIGSTLAATRLPDHRRLYLDYEGPIAGNRGEVRQVGWGHAEILTDDPDRFEAVVTLAGHTFQVEGGPDTPPNWQLHITPGGR